MLAQKSITSCDILCIFFPLPHRHTPEKLLEVKLSPMTYEEFIIEYNTEYRTDHSIRNAKSTPFEVAEHCEKQHQWHIQEVPPDGSHLRRSHWSQHIVMLPALGLSFSMSVCKQPNLQPRRPWPFACNLGFQAQPSALSVSSRRSWQFVGRRRMERIALKCWLSITGFLCQNGFHCVRPKSGI